MITVTQSGSFANSERFLSKILKSDMFRALDAYGREGAAALSSATPVDSGLTAASWSYRITRGRAVYKITWTNAHIVQGVPIAVILQYGHGTGTGGYVAGRDYINPAIRPVFDRIAQAAWKELTSLWLLLTIKSSR